MARPRKATEDVFFDLFASWGWEDQDAALKIMAVLHRQKERAERAAKRTNGQTPAELFDLGAAKIAEEASDGE